MTGQKSGPSHEQEEPPFSRRNLTVLGHFFLNVERFDLQERPMLRLDESESCIQYAPMMIVTFFSYRKFRVSHGPRARKWCEDMHAAG